MSRKLWANFLRFRLNISFVFLMCQHSIIDLSNDMSNFNARLNVVRRKMFDVFDRAFSCERDILPVV